jgi:hypothetical protein
LTFFNPPRIAPSALLKKKPRLESKPGSQVQKEDFLHAALSGTPCITSASRNRLQQESDVITFQFGRADRTADALSRFSASASRR